MDRDLVIYGVSRALIRYVRWHGVYTRATLHKALDQVQRREEEAPVYLELLQQRRIGRPDRLAMASRYIVPLHTHALVSSLAATLDCYLD